MKAITFLMIVTICCTVSLTSQGQGIAFKELPISVSYFGENAFHPGLKVGTFYTFRSIEKSKTYRRKKRQEKYGDKRKLKELSLDYNLGF